MICKPAGSRSSYIFGIGQCTGSTTYIRLDKISTGTRVMQTYMYGSIFIFESNRNTAYAPVAMHNTHMGIYIVME